MTNKWGGTNDMPKRWSAENKREYQLWIDMLRRCYDEKSLSRKKGESYSGCEVCEEWKTLSVFVKDLKTLPGYEQWVSAKGMALDKDILSGESKVYSKKTCCFVPSSVNLAVMNRQNANITAKASESRKVRYALIKDGKRYEFNSEKEASEFVGAKKSTVASCYRYGCKCKGCDVERLEQR